MIEWIKDNIVQIIVYFIIVLSFAWGIFYAYIDIKAKWNIAHLKNCPCLSEVQK